MTGIKYIGMDVHLATISIAVRKALTVGYRPMSPLQGFRRGMGLPS